MPTEMFATTEYTINGDPYTQRDLHGSGGGAGHTYDLEFNNDLDEVTLTEDNVDKTTLPLIAEKVCTRAEYNNMTAEEKARYRIYHFIGEGGTADASDNTVAYTSSDVADSSATSWTSVTPITSGLSLSTLFARVSQMFKNVRYLYNQVTNINASLTWKSLPTVTGRTYIALPSNFKELHIEMHNTALNSFTFDLVAKDIKDSNIPFSTGYYAGANSYAFIQISTNNVTGIYPFNFNLNGTSYNNEMRTTVYYR